MIKYIKYIILILLALLLWTQCSKPKEIDEIVLEEPTNEYPLKFELVKSVPIDNITYPQIYLDEKEVGVYGFTIKGKKTEGIHRFDHEFNPIGTIHQPFGEGPGDSGSGTRYYAFGDRIIATDIVIDRVSYFDRKFKFQKMVRMKKVTPFYLFKSGNLCIANNIEIKKKERYLTVNITSIPSFDYTQIAEFHMPRKLGERILGKDPGIDFFFSEKTQWIYVIDMAAYRIMAFDLKGNLIKRVRVKTREIKIGREEQKKYVRDFLKEWGVQKNYRHHEVVQPASVLIPFEQGFAVIRRKNWQYSSDDYCDGDMFDYHLNPLGKVKVPGFYQCYYIRGTMASPHTKYYLNGHFYLVQEKEDDITLEKWKVSE